MDDAFDDDQDWIDNEWYRVIINDESEFFLIVILSKIDKTRKMNEKWGKQINGRSIDVDGWFFVSSWSQVAGSTI